MSSHCSRYPSCGCSSSCGTKCQLPAGHPALLEKEPTIEEIKLKSDECNAKERAASVPHAKAHVKIKSTKGRFPSNRQPSKKKRKK